MFEIWQGWEVSQEQKSGMTQYQKLRQKRVPIKARGSHSSVFDEYLETCEDGAASVGFSWSLTSMGILSNPEMLLY